LVATCSSPACGTVVDAFASHRITYHSFTASTHLVALITIVTRWTLLFAGVTLIAGLALTPAVLRIAAGSVLERGTVT